MMYNEKNRQLQLKIFTFAISFFLPHRQKRVSGDVLHFCLAHGVFLNCYFGVIFASGNVMIINISHTEASSYKRSLLSMMVLFPKFSCG